MNDVATIISPQPAHRRIYEPQWTTDSVFSNPQAVQDNILFMAKFNPAHCFWRGHDATASIMAMTSSKGPVHLKWRPTRNLCYGFRGKER
jgi:hypothetical protein